MRRLLNTLFVQSEDIYLALENENIVAKNNEEILARIPLIGLENIVYFGYKGASPHLMGECVKRKIGMCFLSPRGRFLARISGMNPGNVLLRKEQYRISDDSEKNILFARNFITAKIFNSRTVLKRAKRDHPMSFDSEKILLVTNELKQLAKEAKCAENAATLLGIEGSAANAYFSLFDNLILQQKNHFVFTKRIKHPPKDKINAMLSFAYTLLAHDVASALESVGLDAYVGFFHRDKPGRASLSLDLMEELRSIYADRFVLKLINNRIIKYTDFEEKEDGRVLLKEGGRKKFLTEWQEKKQEEITHPFLEEKIPWGLVPYVQALLLAKTLRNDLEEYPAFLWK